MQKMALACGAAALFFLAPGTASAQYQMVSPMLYNGPQISFRDHVNKSGPVPAAPRRSADTTADAATLRYRPDPARRRKNLAQFVAKVHAVDAQGATNLSELFARGDVLEQMQTELRPFGLRIDDVADAYATYWISAYQASRGDSSTPGKALVGAVRRQAGAALAATSAFARADDAAKQEMAEALWVQAALLNSAMNGSKGNQEQRGLVAKAATQGARGMGLDLVSMTLTEKGFVPFDK
ncbi:DUF6683 family protein [Sphingomonas sp. MMS12-HWE2-04]|uniref:DUF6683 family protein n=1 Tax=Sphingomonas sp. MMS12-HWE2-04 TaxID=3234199 RepID=UPI00384E98ED